MNSFVEAVETFETAATWLSDEDAPALMALRMAAEELDNNGVQAALLNTFGVHYRSLMKKRPATLSEPDELDALLDG